jgi:hypothetical protein
VIVPIERTDLQQRALDAIAAGVAALQASPGVELIAVSQGEEGPPSRLTAQIDNETGRYESREELFDESTGELSLIFEKILLEDVLHARIYDPAKGPDGVEWSDSAIGEATHDEFFGEVFTAGGTIGKSLDRIVDLMRRLPFEVEELVATELDGQEVAGYRISLDANSINEYFRATGLELVGPGTVSGKTVYDVWIADALVQLAGTGVQFHDGEALPHSDVVVGFRSVSDVSIEAPAVAGD